MADPLYDRIGHDPRSWYVETFWLGTLGPSTTWLLRHVAAELELRPAGFDMEVASVARRIGVGHRHGANSPIWRAIARAVQFNMAQVSEDGCMAFRRRLPPLSARQVSQLPESLRAAHPAPGVASERAKQLAASLLALGEEPEKVRFQLERWRIPCAAQAVAWASAQQNNHNAAGSKEDASRTSVRTPNPLPPLC